MFADNCLHVFEGTKPEKPVVIQVIGKLWFDVNNKQTIALSLQDAEELVRRLEVVISKKRG